MGAAAFYDLDGTLVRTNLVHAFAFSARNQQGILKSITKTVATLASVPMFMAADFYNRRLFNDLFFVRYRGESEDRPRGAAEQAGADPRAGPKLLATGNDPPTWRLAARIVGWPRARTGLRGSLAESDRLLPSSRIRFSGR